MPIYKDPRHGLQLSEALHEAAVIAPIARALLSAFELYHPTGTPLGPVYVVNDLQALSAGIEATASRNAGTTVTFVPCQIDIDRPEESENSANEISVSVRSVGGAMAEALRLARGSITQWELIERLYASDDPSAPAQLPPISLLLSSAQIVDADLMLKASFADPVNVNVPRLTFGRNYYPTLVR